MRSEFQFSGCEKRFQNGNHGPQIEWPKRTNSRGKVAHFFSISEKETEQQSLRNHEMLLPRSG